MSDETQATKYRDAILAFLAASDALNNIEDDGDVDNYLDELSAAMLVHDAAMNKLREVVK